MTKTIHATNKAQAEANSAASGKKIPEGSISAQTICVLLQVDDVNRFNFLFWSRCFKFLTNEDVIASRIRSVVVFREHSRQCPDHRRVNGENVPHIFIEDGVLKDEPVTDPTH